MQCKTCGGSTTPKNTPRGQAFECNQDNGDCYTNNGYATTTWAQSRGNGGGNNFGNRRMPQQQRAPLARTNGDAGQAWGNAKNCAATLMSGAGAGEGVFEAFLALARKIYAAKPTVAKPRPAPEPDEEVVNEEDEEVF